MINFIFSAFFCVVIAYLVLRINRKPKIPKFSDHNLNSEYARMLNEWEHAKTSKDIFQPDVPSVTSEAQKKRDENLLAHLNDLSK